MTAIGYADLFRVKGGSSNEIKIEANLECVVIVSGLFGDLGNRELTASYAQSADPSSMFVKVANGQVQDDMLLRKLGLIDFPNSYFEFQLVRHDAAEAFQLMPKVAYFRVSNATRNTLSAKNIEVTITIAKPSPTGALDQRRVSDDTGLIAQIPVVLRQLVPGRLKNEGRLNFDTVWIASPKPPSDNEINIAKQRVANGASITISPANVFVTYRETDEPDLMLSILSSIVTDNSSQVSSGLEETLRSALPKGTK